MHRHLIMEHFAGRVGEGTLETLNILVYTESSTVTVKTWGNHTSQNRSLLFYMNNS